MHITRIPFAETRKFSKIVTDYLQHDIALKPYYTWQQDINAFGSIMQEKAQEGVDRKTLVESLRRQYGALVIDNKVDVNIQAFEDDNTFCVVTAHQLNIFTGPLYTIYKTVSAIALAKKIEAQYPGKKIVPVFWLGSEDHDFAEINHTHIFGKAYTWEDAQGGACGRYTTASIRPVLDAVNAVLGESIHAEVLSNLFESAYGAGNNLTQATRIILNGLFGAYGLVVIDGDDKHLKAACASIITDELVHRSSAQVMHTALQQFPFETQAFARDINLFYLQENRRDRIEFDTATSTYQVVNTALQFSEAQMLDLVQQSPERFSPNVILRPLFQQKVLPSLAYIGGGGELAYWLQLKAVFAHHKVAFPMVLLRDSFMLIDAPIAKKMDKLGLHIADLFAEEHVVIAEYLRKNAGAGLDLNAEKESMEQMISSILQKGKAIDPALETTILAEKQALMNSLQKLEGKLLKAEKQRSETEVKQISTILQKLFPGGGLQERSDNFIPFYIKWGPAFIDTLLAAAEQPVTGFTVITWSDQS